MRRHQGQAPLSEQEVDELLLFADPAAWREAIAEVSKDQDGLVNYKEFLRPEVRKCLQVAWAGGSATPTGTTPGRTSRG